MQQIFRSKVAYVLGWIWVVFAAVMAADLILRFNGPPSVVAAAVLGVITVLIFLTSMRPATVVREDGLLVRNPLRNTFLPWHEVDAVRVSHSIEVEYGERAVRCWTPQASARERAAASRRNRPGAPRRSVFGLSTEPVRPRGEQAALDALAGRTHADFVAQQITERSERARRGDAPDTAARTTWSVTAIAVSVAAVALVVAAIVVS